MRKQRFFILFICLFGVACSKAKIFSAIDQGPVKKIYEALNKGNYEEALKSSKEISSQIPPGPYTETALYLQSYILAYGKMDYPGVRLPIKQLLDFYPNGKYAFAAQKLFADCQYWQGHYNHAMREYKKLLEMDAGKSLEGYARMQTANCLLLDEKVGDALTAYKEIVEKYPTDPMADSAQLMVANTYLKLQNYKQAKSELRKLMSFTTNKDIQQSAQKALRQLEEEEPFRKGVGVPE